MKCPKCNTECREGLSFCTNCGTKLEIENKIEVICPNCNHICKEDDSFCAKCGTKIDIAEKTEVKCPNCNNICEDGAVFCAKCGTALIPSVKESSKVTSKSSNKLLKISSVVFLLLNLFVFIYMLYWVITAPYRGLLADSAWDYIGSYEVLLFVSSCMGIILYFFMRKNILKAVKTVLIADLIYHFISLILDKLFWVQLFGISEFFSLKVTDCLRILPMIVLINLLLIPRLLKKNSDELRVRRMYFFTAVPMLLVIFSFFYMNGFIWNLMSVFLGISYIILTVWMISSCKERTKGATQQDISTQKI